MMASERARNLVVDLVLCLGSGDELRCDEMLLIGIEVSLGKIKLVFL